MRDFNRSGGSSTSRFAGRDSGNRSYGFRGNDRPERPMMHQAICAECGNSCEVPFKPSGNKQVFCSSCFEKRGGNEARDNGPRREERNFNRFDESYGNRPGRGSSNFERNDRGDREMFSATCDECGKACQLPFRPSSNKPVYCSDCFNMRGERSGLHNHSESRNDAPKGSDNGKEIREIKDQIVSLNAKLEKIMLALNIKPEKVREPKTVKVTKTEFSDATAVDQAIKAVEVSPVSEVAPVEAVKEKATPKKAVKKVVKKKTAVKETK